MRPATSNFYFIARQNNIKIQARDSINSAYLDKRWNNPECILPALGEHQMQVYWQGHEPIEVIFYV